MHFLIMLKPILSNWAAEREEEREAIKAAQRDGFPLSTTLIPRPPPFTATLREPGGRTEEEMN